MSRLRFQWHERIRALLDSSFERSDFVVWIVVDADRDASVDDAALVRDVGEWLSILQPDDVAAQRDEPEYTWRGRGIVVRFTAVPKTPEARPVNSPLVGNPVPAETYAPTRVVAASPQTR